MKTTRERIAHLLREEAMPPSAIAAETGTTTAAAVDHVRHVARSLRSSDESVVVAPPRCRGCGFDGFDDPGALPSRCPSCKSETIDEPTFAIR